MTDRPRALLLLGPTGSGKTPLGQLIESRGLAKTRCHHFDFGENLRYAAAFRDPALGLSADEFTLIDRLLKAGALLEDRDFPVAHRLLDWFLRNTAFGEHDYLVLNGLPRHVRQAECLNPLVCVNMVVSLSCKADDVVKRISNNAGGDRGGRKDDGLDAVAAKLRIYEERTRPLVAHYEAMGARIIRLRVGATTTAEEAWQELTNGILTGDREDA